MASTYLARYNGTGTTGEVILGIHNTTSDKVVKIYKAVCSPTGIVIASTAKWRVKTISAVSGGVDLASTKIVKFDSSNANLPSQVLIREDASTTVDVSDITCQKAGVQTLGNTAQFRQFASLSGPSWPDMNCGRLTPVSGLDSNVQGWILREGDGIAIDMTDADFMTNPRDFQIIFRNTSTGACYGIYLRDECPTTSDTSALVLFNGSGSGIVLEVLEVSSFLNGNNIAGRQYLSKFNKSIDVNCANEITPTKMDSSNPDVPTGIKVYNHVLFDPLPEKLGYSEQPYITSSVMYAMKQRYNSMNTFIPFMPSSIGKGPGRALAGLGGLTNTHQVCVMFDATRNGKPIEVVQNELVGFCAPVWFGDCSGQRYEYTLEFTIEDAVSDYPDENDVEDGVTYGPGDIYEGDFVVPAESDVKVGVDYGGDGTEFEGTYSPASGSTYTRSRVVNPQ